MPRAEAKESSSSKTMMAGADCRALVEDLAEIFFRVMDQDIAEAGDEPLGFGHTEVVDILPAVRLPPFLDHQVKQGTSLVICRAGGLELPLQTVLIVHIVCGLACVALLGSLKPI